MNYVFLLLLVFPIIWLIGAKYVLRHTFNWIEFSISVVLVVGITAAFYFTGKHSMVADTEIWNGQVMKKYQRTESCPSGWRDSTDSFCSEYKTRIVPDGMTCTTNSNGHQTCTPKFKTQYKYIYDWERRWYVLDSFTTHEITRVDDRGTKEPKRWTVAYVGEPASTSRGYVNYVQAVPESLFNNSKGLSHDADIPPYPDKIRDYYRATHVITYKASIPQPLLKSLEKEIGNILKVAGPTYQANVILIVTNENDPMIRFSFERKWAGGNKNDIVVFLGVEKASMSVTWVDVMTWAKNYNNELFQVKLRDDIKSTVDHLTQPEELANTILTNVRSYYDRPEMTDFEYLEARIQPPVWVMWILVLFSVLGPILLTVVFHKNEL